MMSHPFKIATLLILLIVPSCRKHDSGEDKMPVIESISVSPDVVTPGETISVISDVTDPNGLNLTYSWSVSQGSLSEPAKPATQWVISPIAPVNTNSKITLTVSNGIYTSIKVKEVMVSSGITVSGRAFYYGTTIPIPGLTVKIGPFSTITGTDGRFVFPHVTPGLKTIEAEKTGFDPYQKSENISGSNNVFSIGITSNTETRRITGTAKTIDNILLSGIRVVMLNADNTESTLIDTTDAGGHYEIKGIPPGTRSFKFTDLLNPGNILSITSEIEINGPMVEYDAFMKLERNIDMLQNGWEFGSADLSAPYDGTSYKLTSNSADGNRYFRLAYCCTIPEEAENPVAIYVHRLTGTIKIPSAIYYKSPASAQLYMSSGCSTWVDYVNYTYSYWSSPITTFYSEYRFIGSSFKGKTLKFTFGLYRYSGSMPVWEIKSFVVNYYY
jgi:hypothetical protein